MKEALTSKKRLTFEDLKVRPESCEDFVLCPASLIERLRSDLEFQRNKADSVVTLNTALESVVAVAAEECRRQGCHCPGEIKGECSFCRIGEAIARVRS